MKSKILLSLALSISVMGAFAQKDNVGIGTTKPDQSAALEISSSNKGLLTPRMSLQQRNAIQNPAEGLIVYQTDMLSGFYFYDGKEWKPIASETGAKSVADANNWGLTGNAGTNSAVNFIGTTDSQPLVFKSYNLRVGFIDPSVGNTSLGLFALSPTVSGTNNLAFGTNSQSTATSASSNTSVGTNSVRSITTGSSNIGLGFNSLYSNSTGSFNMALGTNTLYHNLGSGNTAIGNNAGYFKNGSYNVYIGNEAGRVDALATESNKLYIHSSASATPNPLILGDFANNNLKINVGATSSASAGFLAVGDFGAVTPMNTVGGYRLIVQDGILTEKIKVAVKNTADWADYVFEKNYKMLPLEQVEKFVQENKHLPNVPSADEMAANGLDVMKTNAILLEKIEELTLYMIEINKEVKALKHENNSLKRKQNFNK